jgi:hypothetical protein
MRGGEYDFSLGSRRGGWRSRTLKGRRWRMVLREAVRKRRRRSMRMGRMNFLREGVLFLLGCGCKEGVDRDLHLDSGVVWISRSFLSFWSATMGDMITSKTPPVTTPWRSKVRRKSIERKREAEDRQKFI